MIPWYVYAFFSVVLGTFFIIYRKKSLENVHSMNFESVRTLSVALFGLLLIPFIDFSIFSWKIIGIVYIVSLLGCGGILFFSKAIKHNQISLIYPLVNIKPVFVVILAYIFLAEKVAIIQMVGIFIILISAYLLESNHHLSDFLMPFKNLMLSKDNLYFLISIILLSITSILDKYVISNHLDIFSYFFIIWIFIAINFNAVHIIKYGFKDTVYCIKKLRYLPFIVGFLSFGANFLALKALSLTYVSLLTPFMMLTTLSVVFFGGRFFHEKYLLFRTVISIIMLVGVYLVIV